MNCELFTGLHIFLKITIILFGTDILCESDSVLIFSSKIKALLQKRLDPWEDRYGDL